MSLSKVNNGSNFVDTTKTHQRANICLSSASSYCRLNDETMVTARDEPQELVWSGIEHCLRCTSHITVPSDTPPEFLSEPWNA